MDERWLRALGAVAVVVGTLFFPAVPTSAHATLLAATPAPGAGRP